jgi:hypothetical protein
MRSRAVDGVVVVLWWWLSFFDVHKLTAPQVAAEEHARSHTRSPPKPHKRTVDLLEHVEHVLQVAVVQEPDRRVLLVLLKRHGKAVGHVDLAFERVAQQDAHDALAGVARDAVVVVHHAQQHERVQDHLFRHAHGCLFLFVRRVEVAAAARGKAKQAECVFLLRLSASPTRQPFAYDDDI